MALLKYMAEQAISPSFYKNLITLATIVAGVLYIERSMKSTVTDTLAPYVKMQDEMKGRIDGHTIEISSLKEKCSLNDYKWSIYETQIRDFIKPEEIEFKRKDK